MCNMYTTLNGKHIPFEIKVLKIFGDDQVKAKDASRWSPVFLDSDDELTVFMKL